jgi:hypothetical protein
MNEGVDKIWLDSYPQGVPAQIDAERYASLVELFQDSVARFAERPSRCSEQGFRGISAVAARSG